MSNEQAHAAEKALTLFESLLQLIQQRDEDRLQAMEADEKLAILRSAEAEGDAAVSKVVQSFAESERQRYAEQTKLINNRMLLALPLFVVGFAVGGALGYPQVPTAIWSGCMYGLMAYAYRSRRQLDLVAWAVVVNTCMIAFVTASDLQLGWLSGVLPVVGGSLVIMLIANRTIRKQVRLHYRTFMVSGSLAAIFAAALAKGALAGLAGLGVVVLVWLVWAIIKPDDLIERYADILERDPQTVKLPWSVRKYSDSSQLMKNATAYTRRAWIPALLPKLFIGIVVAAVAIVVLRFELQRETANPWLAFFLVVLVIVSLALPVYFYRSDVVVTTPDGIFSCKARPPQGDTPYEGFKFVKSINNFRSLPGKMCGWINIRLIMVGEVDVEPGTRTERREYRQKARELNRRWRWIPTESAVPAEISRALMKQQPDDF